MDWNIDTEAIDVEALESHPAWVCGLKPVWEDLIGTEVESHPAWVCGLKPEFKTFIDLHLCHTLRGCVDWNFVDRNICLFGSVTPCVGVWIETWMNWICVFCSLSHPAWVCGLKLDTGISLKNVICHTLRGCVDWNLATVRTFGRAAESHPAWVCGLKHVLYFQGNIFWSHTLRGCVDWNRYGSTLYEVIQSHTLRGCVDWNYFY